MDLDVVEVVARFGGTIIDVAHVGPTDVYRIGTAPGTNLTVPGLTSFPLVDGAKIRHPHGVVAVEHESSTELRVGELVLSLTRAKLPRAPLARPRPDWRPPVFLALSLIAHLTLWLIALTHAPFERLLEKPRPRMRFAHIAQPVPEPEPKPKPEKREDEPEQRAQPASHARVTRSQLAEQANRAERPTSTEEMGREASYWTARVAKSFDNTKVVERVGALREEDNFTEEDTYTDGFSGEKRFDPSTREGFESIKSQGFTTMPLDVKQCANKKTCSVKGPIPALFVRTHLIEQMGAIYECYAQHAEGPGTIELAFTIDGNGAVQDARGSGLGGTGACAAQVAGTIFFKALGNDYDPPRETRVRWTILFKS